MTLSRGSGWVAAGVNLFVIYLGEFWPAATQPLPRLMVIAVFLGSLAAVNYRGVAAGTLVSNATVVAKLLALGMVCVAGVLYLSVHPRVAATPVAHRWMAGCRRCCCCCLPTAAMKPHSTRWERRAIHDGMRPSPCSWLSLFLLRCMQCCSSS